MRQHLFFLALGISAISIFQSCKKGGDDPTPPNGTNPAADSVYIPLSMVWTNFGFGSSDSHGAGVVYNAQNRVIQIGGGAGSGLVKPFYYADGRVSHIVAESPKTFSTIKERNSVVFKYAGNKIVKALYRYISTLPETDTYYSDTIRTDNFTGYYDSLVYAGNNLTEIYHKFYMGGAPYGYKFLIKYPGGTDSTFSIEQHNINNGLENRISGKINKLANPYLPFWALYFHTFNGLQDMVFCPNPMRRSSYFCEYLLPLLPNAIGSFKVENFGGTYNFENGSYVYQMSADSLDLKMTNPSGNYNYERVNYAYKRVHK